MRNASILALTLVLTSCLIFQGCSNILTTSNIDPAGKLSRKDYIALRERGNSKTDHLLQDENEKTENSAVPPPIPEIPALPAPTLPEDISNRLVSVNITEDVSLRDVLIELGREGQVNLELDPRIEGGIIFTAHERPFLEVIDRICSLAGLRKRTEGKFLRIELDTPYQQTYAVDYPSISRRSTSEVTISTNVFDVDVTSSSGNSTGTAAHNSSSGNENNSVAKITGASDADFWNELEKSLTQVIATTPHNRSLVNKKSVGFGDSQDSAKKNFSIDRQAGLVTVFGNSRQQEAVQNYLRRLQHKATAQVLIEARIVEVELSDEFQSGINWRTLFNGPTDIAARFGTVGAGAPFTTAATAANGVFTASVKDKDFNGILNLVRTFGTTRVLSSPRLTVLNNQTAVLKVARNAVYFVTSAQFPTTITTGGVPISGTPVFSSTPRTVPVGLVMTVQPSIDPDRGRITMTLRPTISRVVSEVNDPSIGLNAAQAGVNTPVQSKIPVLAVREMDSVLQLNTGEVAIMGGLMQDSSVNEDKGVPPFDALPLIGNLAKSRDNQASTSELVILLRATILNNPPPDAADVDLYRNYNSDPRPFSFPSYL